MFLPDFSALTREERCQLIDDIDFILGHIGLVFKAALPEPAGKQLLRLEQKINQVIQQAWEAQTKEAVKAAIAKLQKLGANLSALNINEVTEPLQEILGKQLVKMVEAPIVQHTHYAYDMMLDITSKTLDLPVHFTLVDQKAKDWLAKNTLFWIGQYYNNQISENVNKLIRIFALEQGQNAWTTGRFLGQFFSGQYEIPPKYMPTGYVRAEAYWEGLAANAITRASTFGQISAFEQAEVVTYEIIAADDERTCPICRFMDGKTYGIEHAVKMRDALINSANPEDVKAIHSWPAHKDLDSLKQTYEKAGTDGLAGMGISLPDFHFFCRCDIVAVDFKVYDKPVKVEFERPAPKSEVPDNLSNLQYKGSGAYLGGAGKKDIYADKDGNEYIFKPAESKGGVPEEFRAHVQVAASRLAGMIFNPGEYVEIKAVRDRAGRLGTLQKLLPGVEGDLKKIDWKTLTPGQWKMIQQEHVVDWLIGNFDSHAGNFIKLADGRILGIDKEQAFRYITDPKSWKMSLDYHPNAVYGEWEPLYNTIYRAFANNEIDLDLNAVLPALKRLEEIPDERIRLIFRPYAEALRGKGKEAEELLDLIVERKNQVRQAYKEFFTELLQKRYPGYSGKFAFIDEPEGRAQPLAGRVLSKTELAKMTVKTLKEMAKQQKIHYFQQMTKQELVDALADPLNSDKIVQRVRKRVVKNMRGASKGKPTALQAEPKPEVDVFEDLSVVPANPFGAAVKKDKLTLEGQQIAIRRIIDENGLQGYQLVAKVTETEHDKLASAMKNLGAKREKISFHKGKIDKKLGVYQMQRDKKQLSDALVLEEGNAKIYFSDDYHRAALEGYIDIRVIEEDGRRAAAKVRELLKRLDLDIIATDPTPEDDMLMRLSRLAWQHCPDELKQIPLERRNVQALQNLLRNNGIDPARAEKLVEEEVWPGFKTLIEPGISEEYKKAGAEYLFCGGINTPEDVMKIIGPDSPGLMSTLQRYHNGIFDVGGSEGDDVRSGGADSAFVRLVTRNAKGKWKYADHYKGYGYRLIYDVKALERKDWYGYNFDNFGRTRDMWYDSISHIKNVNDRYDRGNEIMFRKGLENKYLIGITCDSEHERKLMIDALKAAGYNKYNGIQVEKFVKVKVKI